VNIPEDHAERIYHVLIGTPDTIQSALTNLFGDDELYDVQDVLEALEELNLERCAVCDWWFEAGALIDDVGNVVGCEQCR
jgi:hypothetical protein